MDIRKELLYFMFFMLCMIPVVTLLPPINTLISMSTPFGDIFFSIKSIIRYLHIVAAISCIILFIKVRHPILLLIAFLMPVTYLLLFNN
jgi:hypothetical protein